VALKKSTARIRNWGWERRRLAGPLRGDGSIHSPAGHWRYYAMNVAIAHKLKLATTVGLNVTHVMSTTASSHHEHYDFS
jgi:hypothetical protein